jgi:hypothetical protein
VTVTSSDVRTCGSICANGTDTGRLPILTKQYIPQHTLATNRLHPASRINTNNYPANKRYINPWLPIRLDLYQSVERQHERCASRRNQHEVQNGVVASRMKGRLGDHVTEMPCGCFLASTIDSQWFV